MRNEQDGIAIIGLSCWYPGARSPLELWENILSKRQQFRRIPDSRLPLSKYYSSDRKSPDMTYGTEAAVIDGFNFDWQSYRIPQKTYQGTDIVHWLALNVALKALKDAGYDHTSLQNYQTGVVLGNTLTGEWTRTNAMRMRWPFFRDAMMASAKAHGITGEAFKNYLKTTEYTFKSVFPEVTEDTLAGALSNTIAGRICNFLDLHGGGYTIDGACSSSLLAVINAARSLKQGDLDIAFVGGIDISLDTFELIGFAKTGALTDSDMRVYDRRASGFIPGEGCGFLLLKRLKDAVRDNDRIYAVLNGWGVSSDGKGGLTAPSVKGQSHAIQSAYNMANYSINDLDFIEGHGTGTPLGDRIEIGGIVDALDKENNHPSIGLTSLKTIIGHTKAAAGIGALIKAVMAVNRRILPPLAGCEIPHEMFKKEASQLYPIIEGNSCDPKSIMKAGVSAMGFGGINSHVTLSSGPQPDESFEPELCEEKLMVTYDNCEVYPLSAHNTMDLKAKVQKLLRVVRDISRGEMLDLAVDCSRKIQHRDPIKAAVVAWKPADLANKLKLLLDAIPKLKEEEVIRNAEFSLSSHAKLGAVAFVYPGQGSQHLNMAKKLVLRHEWAQDLMQQAEDTLADENISIVQTYFINNPHRLTQYSLDHIIKQSQQTQIAQPAICTASAIWTQKLKRIGIYADTVAGHSLGEVTALWSAGKISFVELIEISSLRGQLMATEGEDSGSMAYIAADERKAEKLINQIDDYLVIANLNAEDQTIISGSKSGIVKLVSLGQELGINVQEIPVSNAFHSNYMNHASKRLAAYLKNKKFSKGNIKFFSSFLLRQLDEHPFGEYLEKQMLGRVHYKEAIQKISQDHQIIIEVGPGKILTNLNQKNLTEKTLLLSVDERHGDEEFKNLILQWFVSGGKVKWNEVYQDRFVKAFEDPSDKLYIENPCEKEFKSINKSLIASTEIPLELANISTVPLELEEVKSPVSHEGDALLSIVLKTVHELTGFEKDTISINMRLLDDLNMDSIKANELVSLIAMKLERAGEIDFGNFSNASILELVEAIEGCSSTILMASSSLEPSPRHPHLNSTTKRRNRTPWVRTFTEEYIAEDISIDTPIESLNLQSTLILTSNSWSQQIVDSWAQNGEGATLRSLTDYTVIEVAKYRDIIIFVDDLVDLDTVSTDEFITNLHKIGQFPIDSQSHGIHFIQRSEQLIQLKSFVSSLHHERPDLRLSYLCFDQDLDDGFISQKLELEICQNKNINLVWYDSHNKRLTSKLKIINKEDHEAYDPGLGSQDVILVTGGAKGITAACTLALAKITGSKFALIGSTVLPDKPCTKSQEIFATLDQFKELGIEAQYYSCDILQKDSVSEVIKRIESELGTISSYIHGAGQNKPSPLNLSSVQQAQIEFKVKILGADNFLNSIDLSKIKVFASLTSVIGVLGMPGNAWYALANQSLDRLSRKLKSQFPHIHTVSLAYSVWDELGMGAKLGSVDKLESMGISPIFPQEGVDRFLDGIFSTIGDQQHIITSRMGMSGVELPNIKKLRFIDEVITFHKDLEVISRVTLNPSTDTYLYDHNYKGTYLFPTVFGLEAMAQAVCYTLGIEDIGGVNIENIFLDNPITVGQHGDQIEIYAEVQDHKTKCGHLIVKAGIRCAKTGYKKDHFSAQFVLYSPTIDNYLGFDNSLCPLGIDPQVDLYGPILFQGKSFQRIKEVYKLESDDENEGMAIFRAEYRDKLGMTTILGDPYYRDALLQSAQLIIPKNQCLPIRIANLQVTPASLEKSTLKRMAITDVQRIDETSFAATIKVLNSRGVVLEIMEDYILQFIERIETNPRAIELIHKQKQTFMNFEAHNNRYNLGSNQASTYVGPKEDIVSLWSTLSQRLSLSENEVENLKTIELSDGSHILDLGGKCIYLSISSTTKDRLVHASFSKILPCHLSVNHSAISESIDSELIKSAISNFEAMGSKDPFLHDRFIGMTKVLRELNIEPKDSSIKFKRLDDRHIDFFWNDDKDRNVHISSMLVSNGDHRVYTLVNDYREPPSMTKEYHLIPDENNQILKPYLELSKVLKINAEPHGPQGQSVFVNSFIPDFKSFSNLSRSIYFSHFFNWMGSARELSSVPVLDRIRKLTETGKWGLVTNWSSIEVLGQCRNRDRIVQGRMWCGKISGAYESTVTLNFDWISLGESGIEERIATGKMGFTWVEILGHGIVKPAKFPDYYREFINSMVAQNDDQDSYIPAPEPLKNLTPGTRIFKGPTGPVNKIVLKEKTFETSLFDANLVGNLYFGNYSIWMGKTRDHYLQSIIPEYFQGVGEQGEFRCKDCTIKHLREAMPFDEIRVSMSLSELYDGGLGLYFEFYKVNPIGPDEKLAFGEHKAIWCNSDKKGNVTQMPLPEKLMKTLNKIIVDKTIASVG